MQETCTHGITWEDQCEYCEMVWLKDSIPKAKRALAKDEKRLKELEEKLIPTFLKAN